MKKSLWVKIFAVALVLMCMLTLAACNKEDTPDSMEGYENLDEELAQKAEKGETSKGLIFKKQKTGDVEGYFVSGIGECTDTVVIIPKEYEGLKVIGIAANAFKKSDVAITEVYIPETITSLKHHAFAGCASLEYIKIPDTVTEMGSNTFEGCESLKRVYIGKGITEIPQNAFNGCKSLEAALLADTNVTKVGNNAFFGCEGMIKLTLGNTLTVIGNNAFEGCTSLKTVEIPNSVTSIGDIAFSGCASLTKVTLGNSVSSIGANAFADCLGLTSITVPNSVNSIGNNAFEGCYRLIEIINLSTLNISKGADTYGNIAKNAVYVHNGATKIQEMSDYIAFVDGSNIYLIGYIGNDTEIALPSLPYPTIKYEVYQYAFYNCTGIKSVTISSSVKSIGDGAFKTCTALTDVYFYGSAEQWATFNIGLDNAPLTNATIHYNSQN